MGVPYAEVIGDPIGHSRSPLIHRFWIEKLGLGAEYRATRVPLNGVGRHLAARRGDIWWRGCSVTAPLKGAVARLVGDPVGLCGFLGAVNCVTRTPLSCLLGSNTDIAGIAEALGEVPLAGEKACLIGTGGAARAVLCWLIGQKPAEIVIVARDAAKAERLGALAAAAGTAAVRGAPFGRLASASAGARLVVQATTLGMRGGPAWEEEALARLRFEDGATAFDAVYAPIETAFLSAAARAGARTVDGLAMLVGQAAPAFELFFGAPAPRAHDGELRALLTS